MFDVDNENVPLHSVRFAVTHFFFSITHSFFQTNSGSVDISIERGGGRGPGRRREGIFLCGVVEKTNDKPVW